MKKTMLGWATAVARWWTGFKAHVPIPTASAYGLALRQRIAAVNLQARVEALEETVRKMSDAVFTKQLVTRKVTLVDETGQVRGTLAAEDDGTAALTFMDDNHRRIKISVTDGAPGIYLYDADGVTARAEMTFKNEKATIRVCGADSAEAMLIAGDETVAAIVTDKDGKPRGLLFGKECAQSGTYSWLSLLDAEGEVVFHAPPTDDGDLGPGDWLDWKGVFGV